VSANYYRCCMPRIREPQVPLGTPHKFSHRICRNLRGPPDRPWGSGPPGQLCPWPQDRVRELGALYRQDTIMGPPLSRVPLPGGYQPVNPDTGEKAFIKKMLDYDTDRQVLATSANWNSNYSRSMTCSNDKLYEFYLCRSRVN
jgi:hypothetical protein